MGTTKHITVGGFVRKFAERHRNRPDKPFCFVLGSGASRSSGIRTGEELVQEWLKDLHHQRDHKGTSFEQWLSAEALEIPGFDARRAGDFYAEIYEQRFPVPEDGFAFLETLMAGKVPSFGYSVLAYLLANTQHQVVVTTNFDNLVANALSVHSDTFPRVVGHDELVRFVTADMRRPLVAKIHGDLGFAPKNLANEIAALSEHWQAALKRILARFTPVFIGYAGNDGSLMNFLLGLEPGTPDTLFWCHRRNSPPHERILKVVERHRGEFVEIEGFDELMMRLLDSFADKAPNLVEELERRATEQVSAYKNQRLALAEKLARPPQGDSQRSGGGSSMATFDAEQRGLLSAVGRVLKEPTQKRWWEWQLEVNALADVSAVDAKYREALEALPGSPELLGNYAIFLSDVRQDMDGAERYYLRAIEANPEHADNLGNYAIFLENERQDMDGAERFYQRAIEADPKSARNLGNYADFLENQRHDMNRAEGFYRRAIEADPKDSDSLGNYALFLENERQDMSRAEGFYRRAIEADPKNARNIGNYASFLNNVRQNMESAEGLYQRAIDADPKNADNLGNYALFLESERQDMEGAEGFYQRAIEVDPKHANNLGNYASFLANVRQDLVAAEGFYRRAIDADPKNADNLGNYALFLKNMRQNMESAEGFYLRAIEVDPKHANNLGNYASFLANVRQDPAAAEGFYQRAIEADPKSANNLGNYAGALFRAGKDVEARRLLVRAEGLADQASLRAELAFYRSAYVMEDWPGALAAVKRLLLAGARSPKWPLQRHADAARAKGHPEPDLLDAVAAVISDGAPIDSLSEFQTWRAVSLDPESGKRAPDSPPLG